MTQLTTDRNVFWNALQALLTDLPTQNNITFRYLEMGQLLTHGFFVYQYGDQPNQLHLRYWKKVPPTPSFWGAPIYHLDTIRTVEKTISLLPHESYPLSAWLQLPLHLSEWKGITLDGLHCELQIEETLLTWNNDKELLPELLERIKWIRMRVYPWMPQSTSV